jgi:hypothetical protein
MDFDPDQQWGMVEIPESLAGRKAGTSASDKARDLRRQSPVEALGSRVLGRHTEERAWSKGAFGEKVAAFWLSRLPAGWHVFHDVPVGERGANIDHLAVGPGGVFTVNTKNLSGEVVATPRSLLVNGHATRYLPVATYEASRASKLLSSALGREVSVWPILAFAVDELRVEEPPVDVAVLRVAALHKWLQARSVVLTPTEVTAIASVAHKPSTWAAPSAQPSREGETCECGGTLVTRTRRSDGRRFLGCSSYPRCRRTHEAPD